MVQKSGPKNGPKNSPVLISPLPNVTYIIITVMNRAHTSLILAGISLSRGKGRMDIKVVLQT